MATRIGQEMKLKVSTSDSRLTDNRTPSMASVSYEKLAIDLTARLSISASDVDWNAGAIFTKTLTAKTTLTFSNVKLNKVITLCISGAFTLSIPVAAANIQGNYNGKRTNNIQIHCTNATSGSEEYWVVITTN